MDSTAEYYEKGKPLGIIASGTKLPTKAGLKVRDRLEANKEYMKDIDNIITKQRQSITERKLKNTKIEPMNIDINTKVKMTERPLFTKLEKIEMVKGGGLLGLIGLTLGSALGAMYIAHHQN